ncbi:hypothetical protein H4R18_002386 [Coemansia javaensis]|uniref:PhoD-like phosphatase metallophosphatase domain-containing protein n=1 Tax=Coemansia javaensis TaxID=2761396 RepID=A0A9W8HF81_9FUNG|nr:hypothetical protein H4R18_002386 [Coemansia javaensis]
MGMGNIGRIALALHVLFASFVLWVVPVHALFLADLVVFPVSLLVALRDLAGRWPLAAPEDRRRRVQERQRQRQQDAAASTALREAGTDVQRRRTAGADKPAEADRPAEPARQGARSRAPLGRIALLAVQVALFAMVLDSVYRPLVAPAEDVLVFRAGYVSHDTARMHIRYPGPGPLELRYRPLAGAGGGGGGNVPWESAGALAAPTGATDFTVTAALANLQPATRYAVELHSRQPTLHAATVRLASAEFRTAPPPGTPTRLRFGTGSCIKPNFPYRPTRTPDVYGFASMLEHSAGLDMVMFMGDFIYADVPLYFGPEPAAYRRLYRNVYAAPSARRLMRRVPMLYVYDDHEIKNNWHRQDQPPMGSALAAFDEYNGRPNPPPAAPGVAYYNFTHGNVAFYAWDTRRYRTRWESAGGGGGGSSGGPEPTATMLGAEQKRHFARWLRDVNHTAAVKFVVSSVPVTTGWANRDSAQDTWRGYPTERAEILALTRHVPNLFFLSGDRHEMAAVVLPSGNIEFSTSPVSQFTFPLVGSFRPDRDGERTLHFRRPGHVKYGILDVDTATDPAVPRVTYSLYTTDVHRGRRPAWVYEAKGAPWR